MEKLGYKIRRLLVENVKRIKFVEVVPKSNVVEIAGKNAQGKSSVIDAIIYVLGGKSVIPKEPIRRGEKSAKIILETDEFTVTRTWTSNEKSYLTVAANTGKSPQSFLNDKVNRLSFDPVSFMQMDPKQQESLLREVTGLNTSDLEKKKQELYQLRRDKGHEVNRLKVFREELGQPVYDLPDEEVSTQTILDEIDKETNANVLKNQKINQIDLKEKDLSISNHEIERKEAYIKQAQDELRKLNMTRAGLIADIRELKAEVSKIKPKDVTSLRGDLLSIEEKNKAIRRNQQITITQNELDDKQAEYNDYTQEISDIDTEIQTRILNTKFPIEGLSLNEDGIIFNELPITQASQAEKIKVGLSIAEALNSELQIILIKEASLLDKESMKFIRSYAKIKDYQIWVERVDPSGKDAIIIEDGGVVAQ